MEGFIILAISIAGLRRSFLATMRKISWRVRILVALLLVGGGLILARGLPFFTRIASRHKTPLAARAMVTIPPGQDLFTPFILPVQVNTAITWENDDSVAHRFATTPAHSAFLNPLPFSFTVAAGQHVTLLFSSPGLYHYYDTTLGTWNTTYARVVAHSGIRHYPLAMDGVIWVQGSITGLPLTVLEYVLQGHDMFSTEFLAIAPSGTVTWHNLDEDAHFVGLVAGWSAPVNPVDIGLYRLAGTDQAPGGQSVTVIFPTPGLYYYYCRNHDQIDQASHRVHVLTMASDYPIPMEGFILVV